MIPTLEEFQQWAPRECAMCHQPLTWPCISLPIPRGAIHLHPDCIWPFLCLLLDEQMRLNGNHPDQLPPPTRYKI